MPRKKGYNSGKTKKATRVGMHKAAARSYSRTRAKNIMKSGGGLYDGRTIQGTAARKVKKKKPTIPDRTDKKKGVSIHSNVRFMYD